MRLNSHREKKKTMRLICGYRRTGKDTLYQQLNGEGQIPFNWTIYAPPGVTDLSAFHRGGPRAAFADALKGEVQQQLRTAGVVFDYEAEKDTRVFRFQHRDTTYRQECIDHGRRRREQDKDCWVKIVMDAATPDTIVTDFRFPNEYDFLHQSGHPLTTIRVFRGDVPIPDVTEPSEHSLDTFKTDFLLVLFESDFTDAVQRFPQYRDYVRVG